MSKTKADLERENAAQRDIIAALGEEIEALRGIFTAAGQSPRSAHWILGYISGIGASDYHHGNVPQLRVYARDLRAPVPAVPGCPAMTEVETLDETVFLPCDREDGHKGSHHAEEDGRHVAWSDCPVLSDAATPCTLHAGHDGPHRDRNGFEWGGAAVCDEGHVHGHGNLLHDEDHGKGEPDADRAIRREAAEAYKRGEVPSFLAAPEEPFASVPRLPRLADAAQATEDDGDRCPDCGRASCTGEGCYWPDEAGIARPEASRP